MASRNARRLSGMAVLLLAAVSCRSLLDITPGHPVGDAIGGDDAGGGDTKGGTKSGGSGGNSQGGSIGDAGAPTGATGGGGKGSGGKGGNATSGSGNLAGDGMGGEGGAPATNPFPEGSCQNCIARNCAAVAQACEDDPACAGQIDRWLGCVEADANACVVEEPGALHDLEACGAESCDLCRHQTDGAPSIDILTPSNGAKIKLSGGLFEVAVQVKNFKVTGLGACGMNTSCGHIHLNIDAPNCKQTPFYNQWIVTADAQGNADATMDTMYCMPVGSELDHPVKLTASLSDSMSHADRIPAVQATVTVTLSQ